MVEPKVSIIIPAYNAENSLHKCLESVFSQNYFNLEVIVVDDGSSDKTLDIARKYSPRVNVYTQVNKGACSARNLGIKVSTGHYIKFLDADDYLHPNAISEQVNFVKGLKSKYIPYGFRMVSIKGFTHEVKEEISSESQFIDLINKNITITLPLHRRDTLIEVGLFDESLNFRQEWDLHLRLANKGYIFLYHNICIFTQVVSDSIHRISSRALDLEKEIENLNYVKSKFESNYDSQVAWSHKYWNLGRQFLKINKVQEAKHIFLMAKRISPNKYLSLQPFPYQIAAFFLGPARAEKIIYLYKLISKKKV